MHRNIDHHKLLSDTSEKMGRVELDVIYQALCYKQEATPLEWDEARLFYDMFVDTGRLPEAIESFCIDIMTDRIKIKPPK